MPMSLTSGVSVATLSVLMYAAACSISAALILDAPEPSYMGDITADPEKNTFAYNLLDDPDLVGAPPSFSLEISNIAPALGEEKNSWTYRIHRATTH